MPYQLADCREKQSISAFHNFGHGYRFRRRIIGMDNPFSAAAGSLSNIIAR